MRTTIATAVVSGLLLGLAPLTAAVAAPSGGDLPPGCKRHKQYGHTFVICKGENGKDGADGKDGPQGPAGPVRAPQVLTGPEQEVPADTSKEYAGPECPSGTSIVGGGHYQVKTPSFALVQGDRPDGQQWKVWLNNAHVGSAKTTATSVKVYTICLPVD
ncbi:hypothetical protein ACH4SP_11245 [Streptomyces sp. NPDC021093]|uniref:hypothetical protein n=1 Tax=Streptomyces sp. NPDC021093 TaxID=3365112 RepID=UPI0037A41AD4